MQGHYRSETKSPRQRAIQKAIKIRQRLGRRKGGIVVPFSDKPKAMHWKTYWTIRFAAEEREHEIRLRDLAHLKKMRIEDLEAQLAREKLGDKAG